MTDNVAELKAKRDELKQRLQDIEADFKRGLDADTDEQAIQLENAEVLEGIAKAAADELERIEKQLADLGES